MSYLDYRPDIDGLRAIAILSVVVFHVDSSFMPGGFLGVDIFFVISGYLISFIIFREIESKTFSFAKFYSRRIRRLFPALITILGVVLFFGYFALFSDEYKQLGQHASDAITFLLNFQLMKEAGYFDIASDFKPLLHLWSLSVEEQFYLLWPLLVFLGYRLRTFKGFILSILGLSSYAFAIYYSGINPDALFYNPFVRFWELLAGCGLAYWHLKKSIDTLPSMLDKNVVRNFISVIGIGSVLYPLFKFNNTIPHPSPLALVPVLGVVAVIASGRQSLVSRILSVKPLVFIGLISYPLYLWHWPLLSYSKIMEAGHPPVWLLWLIVATAIMLAWGTYVLIEKPVRYARRARRSVFALSTAMLVLFLPSYIIALDGLPDRSSVRYVKNAEAQMIREPMQDDSCKSLFESDGAPVYCRQYNPGQRMIGIIGDSHAHVLFPGVSELAAKHNYGTLLLANSGCPPLVGTVMGRNSKEKQQCAESVERIVDTIANDQRIVTVIIATRGPQYLTGKGYGPAEANYNRAPIENWSLSNLAFDADPISIFRSGLNNTIERISQAGKSVIYFLQVPELGVPPKDYFGRPISLFHNNSLHVDVGAYRDRMKAYRKLIEQLRKERKDFTVIDPLETICDKKYCYSYINDQLLYADNNHLSINGSRLIAPLILSHINM